MIYSMPPIIANLALILLYFFGFMTIVSFAWFIVVLFKKKKESVSEMTELTTAVKALVTELKSQKIKNTEGVKPKRSKPTTKIE